VAHGHGRPEWHPKRTETFHSPVRCPQCGTWFRGEHRCPPEFDEEYLPGRVTLSPTLRCTCPPAPYVGDNLCALHRTTVTM
jgi:hypothetical protein